MSYQAESVQPRETARTHIYAAEQLYLAAERSSLYLRDFTQAELWAVQTWLLAVAQHEANAAQVALEREEKKGAYDAK